MEHQTAWFILKTPQETCQIIITNEITPSDNLKIWGPFDSQEKAIAARIGLIRSGKCKPN